MHKFLRANLCCYLPPFARPFPFTPFPPPTSLLCSAGPFNFFRSYENIVGRPAAAFQIFIHANSLTYLLLLLLLLVLVLLSMPKLRPEIFVISWKFYFRFVSLGYTTERLTTHTHTHIHIYCIFSPTFRLCFRSFSWPFLSVCVWDMEAKKRVQSLCEDVCRTDNWRRSDASQGRA